MRKASLLFSSLVFLFFTQSNAQDFRHCATDEMVEKAYLQYPELKRNKEIQDSISVLEMNQKPGGIQMVPKVIPVVIHVIHNYGLENVSKAQVLDAIRIINLDFKKLNPDTTQVDPQFQSIIGNADVEFRLAGLDPNGNCTEGITRTASGLTYSAGENVKALVAWPANRYLNIWVVNTIASGAGGYAYYPGSAPPGGDGIVVRSSQFGSIGASGGGNFAARTLTHEIGHYLNLRHTWGNSNTPGLASNCNIDDDVADTPNTVGTVGQTCNFSQITCGSIDNVNNYMDYSSCGRMFTNGQETRMNTALNSSTGARNNLWSPANLTLTGTNDGFIANTCKPRPDFNFTGKNEGCQGLSVTFVNTTYNAPIDSANFTWIFDGGAPAASNSINPVVSYPNPGIYQVKLIASTSGGTDSVVKTDYVKVYPVNATNLSPFLQDFENPSVFTSQLVDERWDIIKPNTSNLSWQTTTVASFTGVRSMYFPGFNAPTGQIHSFVSPAFKTLPGSSVPVTFKVAYARKIINPVVDDVLKVFLTLNCGDTWVQRFSKFGSQLYADPQLYTSQFIPVDTSQWKTEQFVIFANINSNRIRFEFTTSEGQNIFIDDINVGGFILNLQDFEYQETGFVTVKPNPGFFNETEITLKSSMSDVFQGHILDVSGKQISKTIVIEAITGNYTFKLHEVFDPIPAGMYFLHLNGNQSSHSIKLVIAD